jgi:hypothetical protein
MNVRPNVRNGSKGAAASLGGKRTLEPDAFVPKISDRAAPTRSRTARAARTGAAVLELRPDSNVRDGHVKLALT